MAPVAVSVGAQIARADRGRGARRNGGPTARRARNFEGFSNWSNFEIFDSNRRRVARASQASDKTPSQASMDAIWAEAHPKYLH